MSSEDKLITVNVGKSAKDNETFSVKELFDKTLLFRVIRNIWYWANEWIHK